MKRLVTIVTALAFSLATFAQAYMTDIGSPNYTERLHDAIIIGTGSYANSLLAGVTNQDGFDRVMLSSLDANDGSLLYQKKYNIAYTTAKERTVITSVKIAHDNASSSTTCMMAGSYTRTTISGSPLGYGLFSLTFDANTGNILSIKRWESSVGGVTSMNVASVCAGPGNNFYITGNIKYANPELYIYVMALNSSNNLIWNTIDHDAPTLTGSFNVADIVYSPYTPSGVNEVVIAGYWNPYVHGNPSNVFVRRFNAGTGALIAQNLIGTGNNEVHLVASIIPSTSSAGVHDGFLICGTREDNTATQCAWIIKTNTTASAVTWSKSYKYNVAGSQFRGTDIAEAIYTGLDPYSFYIIGTATNGISGATSDAAAIKIDANGSVLWFTSFTPSLNTTNKNEEATVAIAQIDITNGLNIYGTRSDPSNYSLADMYSLRLADFETTTGYYTCEHETETPYIVTDVSLSVSTYTTENYAVLNSQSLIQTITTISNAAPICYASLLVGGRLASVNDPDITPSFGLYPNPSAGHFTLTNSSGLPATVSIYDLSGRPVAEPVQTTATSLEFDLSNMQAGIYLVHVNYGDGEKVLRLIKE